MVAGLMRRLIPWSLVVLGASLLGGLLAASPANAQERRVALLIGNSAYAGARPQPHPNDWEGLSNPARDAAAIGARLKALKFDVEIALNLDRDGIVKAISRLHERGQGAQAVLLYFSGHGAAVDNVNYLIPTDARPIDDGLVNVVNDGLRLEAALAPVIRIRGATKIVIIDACRNRPRPAVAGLTRSSGWDGGMIRPPEPPDDTVIVFATEEGRPAEDRPAEPNGAYAQALLKALAQDRLSLSDVITAAERETRRITNGRQRPKSYGSDLTKHEFSFLPLAGTGGTAAQATPQPAAMAATDGTRARPSEPAAPPRDAGPPVNIAASSQKSRAQDRPSAASLTMRPGDVGISAEETSNCFDKTPLRFTNRCADTISAYWCFHIGPAGGDWRQWTNGSNSCQAGVSYVTAPIGPNEAFVFPQDSIPYSGAFVAGLTFVGGVRHAVRKEDFGGGFGDGTARASADPKAGAGDVRRVAYQYRTTSGNLRSFELELRSGDQWLRSEEAARCLALDGRRFKNECGFPLSVAWCYDTGTASGDWRKWDGSARTCDASANHVIERLNSQEEFPFPPEGPPISPDGRYEAPIRFLGGVKHSAQ